MKKFIIFIFILISNFAFGQDGIIIDFEIKFKVERTEINNILLKGAILDDFDIYIDESRYFFSRNKINQLKYNPETSEYTIKLEYEGIDTGSQLHFVWCPEIYLKVNLEYDFTNSDKRKYSKLIPIYFDKTQGNIQKYNLGPIYLSNFVGDIIKYNTGDIVESYQIIQVKADKSVTHLREGEYEQRKTDKLVKLEYEK